MKSGRILLLAVVTLCALIALCACGGGDGHTHAFGEWEITKNPACTDDGEKVRYCTCGETQKAIIPATKHNVVISEAKAPTCASTGLTEGKHCSLCNEVLLAQQTIPEVAHTYDDKYDETCNECGFVRDADCAHTETETIKGYAATCTYAGLTDGTKCKKCGEILTPQVAISIVPHTEVIDQAIAATCTTTGLTEGKHCSTCGATLTEQIVVPAAGHNFGDWVVVKEATATEEGLKERYCACGEKEFETIAKIIASSKGLAFALDNDGVSYSVTGIGTCTDTDVVIPDTYNNLPVTSIGDSAFYDCTSFTNVVIGDSVTSIGLSAFANCSSLNSVIIPDSVTSIGLFAFAGCSSLTGVVIPDSVTSIGQYAFASCSSLTSIVIPDSVTSITKDVFYSCSNLQFNEYKDCKYLGNKENLYHALIEVTTTNLSSYIIHEDAKVIAANAFYNCSRLTSIVIPDSLTSIGRCAFWGCTSLTSIVIPDSVTSIGDYAFRDCSSLISIVIPDSVTSIGDYTFLGCTSLTSIEIPDGVTSIGNFTFYECSSLTSIKYCGTEEQWNAISKGSYWNSGTGKYTITYNYDGE